MIYNLKLILRNLAQIGLGMVAVYAIFDFLSKFGRTLYDFVVITLINSIKNIPDEIEKGIFKSNKEKHQGIGLINVEKVLKKYDGNLRINYDEKIFKVNMVIPEKE